MISVENATNPLAILSTVVSVVVAPLVAWLWRNASEMFKRVNDIDNQLHDVQKDVDKLTTTHESNGTRLTKVEEAIVGIRDAMQRSDAQFGEIMVELKGLTRVTALLETYTQALSSTVPRHEVEARLHNAEERLRIVEADVRHGRKK